MADTWQYQKPSKHVSVSDIPDNIDESKLARLLNDMDVNFEDIRLIPKKGLHAKAHALVTFYNTKEAMDWVEDHKGVVSLLPDLTCPLGYAQPTMETDRKTLWKCMCGALNVELRKACFKCLEARPVGSVSHSRGSGALGLPGQPGAGRNGGYDGEDMYDPEESVRHYRRPTLRGAHPEDYDRMPPRAYPRELPRAYREEERPFPEEELRRPRRFPGEEGRPVRRFPGEEGRPVREFPGEEGRPVREFPGEEGRPVRRFPGEEGRPVRGFPGEEGRPVRGFPGEEGRRPREFPNAEVIPGREFPGAERRPSYRYPGPPASFPGGHSRPPHMFPGPGEVRPPHRFPGPGGRPQRPFLGPDGRPVHRFPGQAARPPWGHPGAGPGVRPPLGVHGPARAPGPGGHTPSGAAAAASAAEDGTDQLGKNPCNTVLLRGLDGLSDEQRILDSLANITSLEPKNCYVMRNLKTNVSLGYGFMEFESVADAKKIVDYFSSRQAFEVDGKLLMVDFAKNTYKTIMAGIMLAKDQYQTQMAAKAEKEKLMRLEAEEKAKRREKERERLQMERRDIEMKQQQEMARKKAEEALEKIRKEKAEAAAKARAEEEAAAAAAAKFAVEPFTGYKYDTETGLYVDRGQFIPERCCFVGHSMANNLDLRIFDEKEIVPNGKLEDLIAAAVKLLDSSTLQGHRVCCYVFFGITDLLDVKQGHGYREVVLRESGDTLLMSKIDWAVKALKDKGVLPMLCTFPPMSFAKHNQFLLKNGLTGKLELKLKYSVMQAKLNEKVASLNTRIEQLNCETGVVTCQLSTKIFVQDRGRYILKDVYLKDGLHPTSQGATLLNVELAQNLRKAKQGKRSPDWLKKSHQIKSSSSISFSIKKKEEQSLKTKSEAASKTSKSPFVPTGVPPPERRSPSPRRAHSTRRSRSPRRRSRSPRRRNRSPRRRSRSLRNRSRSPRWSRSPGRDARSGAPLPGGEFSNDLPSLNRNASLLSVRPFSNDLPARNTNPQSSPFYQSIPVPQSQVQQQQIPDKIDQRPTTKDKKTQGSFTLSAFLGSLSAGKNHNNDSGSEESMSMSPPKGEKDPDIEIITQPPPDVISTDQTFNLVDASNIDGQLTYHSRPRSRSASPSRRSRSPRQRLRRQRSTSRTRSSYSRRSRGQRSRSRTRRSRSRSRHDDRHSSRHKYHRYSKTERRARSPERRTRSTERARSTSSTDRFGRTKMKNVEDRFQASVPDHREGLLGDAPQASGLLGDAPQGLLGDAPSLDKSHDLMFHRSRGGYDSFELLDQELRSPVSDEFDHKRRGDSRSYDSLEEQKNKIFKMLQKDSGKDDPFNAALNQIYQSAQSGQFRTTIGQADVGKSSNDGTYGYGFATTAAELGYGGYQEDSSKGGYGGYN